MPSYEWRQAPPELSELEAACADCRVVHYWVRGWNFNRPVIAEVAVSTRANPLENFANVLTVGGVEVFEPTTSPRFTNLELLPGWAPFEWAGPIPMPGSGEA